MKTLVITAVAALALGAGTALAAQAVDKPGLRAPAPDGLVQNEDRARRWMRTWRDEQRDRYEQPTERNWGEEGGRRGKTWSGRDEQAPVERSWRGRYDDWGTRPPKPRD